MSPMRVQMAAPPTPKSARHVAPSPRPFSVAAQLFKMPPPSAAQTSAWQTPTITRFLSNSQKGRTPGTLTRPLTLGFGPASAASAPTKGFADTSVILEGSQADGESLLDDTIIDEPDMSDLGAGAGDDNDTVMLAHPPPVETQAEPDSPEAQPQSLADEPEPAPAPALVEPPLEPIPAVEATEEPAAAPAAPADAPLTEAQTAILVRPMRLPCDPHCPS